MMVITKSEEILRSLDNALRSAHAAKLLLQAYSLERSDEEVASNLVYDLHLTVQSLMGQIEISTGKKVYKDEKRI